MVIVKEEDKPKIEETEEAVLSEIKEEVGEEKMLENSVVSKNEFHAEQEELKKRKIKAKRTLAE